MDDAQKMAIAKRAAAAMFSSMAGMPSEVQLEASLILTKALFMGTVQQDKRIMLFNSVVQKMRKELQQHIKTGENNYGGYGPANRRKNP